MYQYDNMRQLLLFKMKLQAVSSAVLTYPSGAFPKMGMSWGSSDDFTSNPLVEGSEQLNVAVLPKGTANGGQVKSSPTQNGTNANRSKSTLDATQKAISYH